MLGLLRRGRRGIPATVLAAAPVLVLVATTLGLRPPAGGLVDAFPVPAGVDYSRGRAIFERLRPQFLAAILGGVPADVSALPGREGRGLQGGIPSSIPRVVVDVPRLSNDDFSRAYPIPARLPFTGREDTRGATAQSGEPGGCGGGGSVWYRYTSPSDERLTANTFDSSYPTQVAVYRGRSLTSLQAVRCDRDGRGETQAVFPARAGVTYFFRVTPLHGRAGRLVFTLEAMGRLVPAVLAADGGPPDGDTAVTGVAADDRTLATWSWADDLVPRFQQRCQPTNYLYDYAAALGNPSCGQVYTSDLFTGVNRLASRSSVGVPADNAVALPTISGDGRTVAFASVADNLVGSDPDDLLDGFDAHATWTVLLHDVDRGLNAYGSVSSLDGMPKDGWAPHVSFNGRYIAFTSGSRLVAADRNEAGEDPRNPYANLVFNSGWDTYVRDRWTGADRLVGVSSSGVQGTEDNGGPQADYAPSITPDGRYVVFASDSSNLVPGDTNHATDVFVHDLVSGATRRASVGSDGTQADGRSILFVPGPNISADGRYIVFGSYAPNLTPVEDRPTAVTGRTVPGLSIFLHDMTTGVTTLLSPAPLGGAEVPSETFGGGNNLQDSAAISADGRFVVFSSRAQALTGDDRYSGTRSRVFVRDLYRGTISRISVNPTTGADANGDCGYVTISPDGRVVVFNAQADNVIAGFPGFSKFPPGTAPPMFPVVYMMPSIR